MSPRLGVSLRAASVRRAGKWVLRGVTWELKPGECWALLGENGAGKTQLLKLVSGDIWPTPTRAAIEMRSYRIGRHALDLLDAKQRIAYVGGERQDKYARYGWNLRVREVIATGVHRTDLLLAPVTRTQAAQTGAVLRACGIARLAARKFLSLSYGEKRLVLLARALAQRPDWLLLDEIYNGLDAGYRRRIDAVLAAARAKGLSWIATAHRAVDVPPGTRSVIELREGRILRIERLSTADLARLRARAAERPPRTVRRRQVSRATKPVRGPLLLRLINVDLYVEYRAVLRAVNWNLRQGEHWSVFGANGAGKSSFLKLLYGDLSPAWGGTIVRAGLPAGTPLREWQRRVGYVSPELQSLCAMDVELIAGRRPRELSYGELRLALIARAMAADPKILLLDEPLTGLDPEQRTAMKRLLQRLMRRVTIVVAVHHPEDLPKGMTHALHLHKQCARVEDSGFAT